MRNTSFAMGNFIKKGSFDFGILEHIDLGIEYDPSTDIYGMNFYEDLSRPCDRVQHRKRRPSKVGFQHRLKIDDGIKCFQKKFNGIILP